MQLRELEVRTIRLYGDWIKHKKRDFSPKPKGRLADSYVYRESRCDNILDLIGFISFAQLLAFQLALASKQIISLLGVMQVSIICFCRLNLVKKICSRGSLSVKNETH